MNHKRKRPKSRRAGCLLCKPQKLPANKRRLVAAAVRRQLDRLVAEGSYRASGGTTTRSC